MAGAGAVRPLKKRQNRATGRHSTILDMSPAVRPSRAWGAFHVSHETHSTVRMHARIPAFGDCADLGTAVGRVHLHGTGHASRVSPAAWLGLWAARALYR